MTFNPFLYWICWKFASFLFLFLYIGPWGVLICIFFFQIIFVQFWYQGTAGLRQCVWNYSIFRVHIELHVKLLWFIPLMLIFISIVICAIMRRIFTTTVLILEQHRFELCRSIYMGIVLCVCYSTTFLWLVESMNVEPQIQGSNC